MSTFEIRDPIHQRIAFNEFERKVIDHRLVQRLRFISQLSFLQSYVYPGATHDRFSHALGAMQVAGRLIGRMKESLEGSSCGTSARHRPRPFQPCERGGVSKTHRSPTQQ